MKISHFSRAQPKRQCLVRIHASKSSGLALLPPLSPWTLSLALWIKVSTHVHFPYPFTCQPHIQRSSSPEHLTFRTQKTEPILPCLLLAHFFLQAIKHQTAWQREDKEGSKVRGGLEKGEETSPSLPLEWLRVVPQDNSKPHPSNPTLTQDLLSCYLLH